LHLLLLWEFKQQVKHIKNLKREKEGSREKHLMHSFA
jgi:hypothetical protein